MSVKKVSLPVILALLAHSAFGQAYTIQTIAGSGWDIPALVANLSSIQGVALDGAGNVFMALSGYSVVVKLDASGKLSLVAGNGTQGFSGDGGPATLAQLGSPTGVAVDSTGNVYIADTMSDRIRMVSNGIITTIAGNGTVGFTGDNGPATDAELGFFAGAGGALASDSTGNIYFGDNNRIRKISHGVISTIAGGGFSYSDNIPATSAAFAVTGIAVDAAGYLYFSDPCANRIRKVSNGIITTLAGNGVPNFFACATGAAGVNGAATSVSLDGPAGVAVDTAGNVYFMEGMQASGGFPARARKVSNGIITTVAGGSTGPPVGTPISDNIPATTALLSAIGSIAVDTAGSLYIPDFYWLPDTFQNTVGLSGAIQDGRLRKVSNGIITTIAGSFGVTPPGIGAIGAQLNLPAGLALDNTGTLYIADSGNNIVRAVSNGNITTIAGTRILGYQGDGGPAIYANLWSPQAVALDTAGNVYIGDTGNGNIREISRGTISTAAAAVGGAFGLALDAAGNLYFADETGNTINELSNGVVTTIAGDGTLGFGGDNGPAASAQLAGPSGIALDGEGNIFFADTGNQRVRRISHGVITTVAGNGTAGYSGDNGPATGAQLNFPVPVCMFTCRFLSYQYPAGIAVDSSGNLYIADSANQRVRKVSNGVITTIAGNGTPGYSGDGGPAVSAQLYSPSGIAVNAEGTVYVSDSSNGRVRVLTPPACTFDISPSAIESPAFSGTFTIMLQTAASCSWSISGAPNWISVSLPPQSLGSANFVLKVAADPGPGRIANLVVGGQPVTVTQTGRKPRIR